MKISESTILRIKLNLGFRAEIPGSMYMYIIKHKDVFPEMLSNIEYIMSP